MNTRQAKRYALLALILAGGITTVRSLTVDGKVPSVRVAVGVFVAALMLTLLAEVAPPIAGGLAVLIIVSTLLTGGEVWTAVGDLTTRRT